MSLSPSEVNRTLAQGAVYLMRHRLVTSPKLHFVVVMNESPNNDVVILFNVVTSNIDNVRKLLQKTGAEHYTAVDLSPNTESFLSVNSIVNCNDCKMCNRGDFITDLSSCQEAKFMGNISSMSLSNMITAALASKQVKPFQKQMISPHRFTAIEDARLLPENEQKAIHITVGC